MVMHPPAFESQKAETDKWNEGFAAGLKEAMHEIESHLDVNDPEGPTRKWVEETTAKLTNKYL